MTVTALRRKYLLRLLAQLDQQIAECEDLASQPVLADDEQEYLAVQLTLRRQWQERVEEMLAELSWHKDARQCHNDPGKIGD